MKELRVKLEGDEAQLGRVPAADVARLLILLERAAAQAAAVALGQPKTTTGRYKHAIEQAVRFRLVGIEDGSVVPVLELPEVTSIDPEKTLDLQVPGLGESAIDALIAAAEDPSDPVIARALLSVADGMRVGERYESLTFVVASEHRPRREVKVDGETRAHLRDFVDSLPVPLPREDDLVGVLVEADFEKRTARLRTPAVAGVEVSFSDAHAEAIQQALRRNSTVRGDVAYDPMTHVARSIRLTEIVRGVEQLVLDPDEFWREPSLEELARRQGSGQPVDPADLHDDEATDEERDAFMTAIAELD